MSNRNGWRLINYLDALLDKATPALDVVNKTSVMIVVVTATMLLLPLAMALYFADTCCGKNRY
jgi:hypothetical protein